MRARQRHLKPKALGVLAAYDARYITGLSDGAAVSSWSDLSGNSFSATQGTTARQPVYKTATLGGSPSVRFDGAGDNLTHSITNNATYSIVSVVSRLSSQTGYRGLFALGTTGATGDMVMLVRMTVDKWGTYSSVEMPATTTLATSSPSVLTMTDNAASGGSFFLQGAADGTWTGNSIGQGINHLGGYYTASPLVDQTANIDVGMFLMTAAPLSDALRKRVEKAYGYSFKIACS